MKNVKKWLGLVLGGAAALVGMSAFVTGCDDDDKKEDSVKAKYTYDEVACCGEDDGSASFNSCIDSYKKTGACGSSSIGGGSIGGGGGAIALYGMPSDIVNPDTEKYTDAEKECCGDNTSSASFKSCIEDYRKTNSCLGTPDIGGGDENIAVYGMPSELIEAYDCCDGLSGDELNKCVDDYVETRVCNADEPGPGDDIIVPDEEYTKDELECCGEELNETEFNACIKNYREGFAMCGGVIEIEPTPTVYGPAPQPDELDIDEPTPEKD